MPVTIALQELVHPFHAGLNENPAGIAATWQVIPARHIDRPLRIALAADRAGKAGLGQLTEEIKLVRVL
jgi:hypothetical protein